MEIKQLQATLELLKKEKEGTLPGSQLDLDNNAFRVDYLDDQVLQKPQVLNLVEAVNKFNEILGNKKCLSLLKPWAWSYQKLVTSQHRFSRNHKINPLGKSYSHWRKRSQGKSPMSYK